jgi:hypothetical protein
MRCGPPTVQNKLFDKFPKYDIKILLQDLNLKVGMEDIFRPAENYCLHKISNDEGEW